MRFSSSYSQIIGFSWSFKKKHELFQFLYTPSSTFPISYVPSPLGFQDPVPKFLIYQGSVFRRFYCMLYDFSFSGSCSDVPMLPGLQDSNYLCFQSTRFSGPCLQVSMSPGLFSGHQVLRIKFRHSDVPTNYIPRILGAVCSQLAMFQGSCSHVPMWPGLFVPKVICSQATRFSRSCSYIPLFTGLYDSNDLCFQATMFSGSCFRVPMFPGLFSGSCFISSYVPRPYVLKIMFFKKNLNSYSLSLQGHMLPQTYFTFP